jgi:membrane-associated phospholipid phosphatase
MSLTGRIDATGAGRPSWWRRVDANVRQGAALVMRPLHVPARPAWLAPGRLALGAIATVAVVGALMLFADGAAIAAAAARRTGLLAAVFEEVTDFGKSGWFLWPLGLPLLGIAFLASPLRPRFEQRVLAAIVARLAFLFTAIALPGLIMSIVKRLIGRARPFAETVSDPFHYMLGVWRPDYASLPSGHATTSFAAAMAIGLLFPRLRPLLWTYAVIIAMSRVILTAHFPSDVVAGAIVGSVGALLVRDLFAARRLGFAIGLDGRVRALPGPSFARIKRVARGLRAP